MAIWRLLIQTIDLTSPQVRKIYEDSKQFITGKKPFSKKETHFSFYCCQKMNKSISGVVCFIMQKLFVEGSKRLCKIQ